MAGNGGPFVNVRGAVLVIVAFVGIFMCIAWLEHMRSFGILFRAKFGTLRHLEEELGKVQPLKPFTIETKALKNGYKQDKEGSPKKWRYTPLTAVDTIAPAACILLFISLLLFKI
jgi:hypothetical protein